MAKYFGFKDRAAYLKSKYGITEADYEGMLGEQNGVCAICLRPPKKIRLAIDHNHASGKIRGLLCKRCNYRLLPTGQENADLFQRAADYLKGK